MLSVLTVFAFYFVVGRQGLVSIISLDWLQHSYGVQKIYKQVRIIVMQFVRSTEENY